MYNNAFKIKHLNLSLVFLSASFLFICGCNPTKRLKPDQLFLKQVKIKNDTRKIDKNEIATIIKQKPNKKILGIFRFHLGFYNLFRESSNSKIKENIGEPPVVYDSLLMNRSVNQLNLHLKNKGYFDNEVNSSVLIKKNKVKVKYIIKAGKPYLIDSITYNIQDKEVLSKVVSKHYKSTIKKEQPIDIDKLNDERNRIKKVLRNEGYYYFNTDYVKFKVDSTIGNKKVNLTTVVLNKENALDTGSLRPGIKHQKYLLNKIGIYLSDNFKDKNIQNFDTAFYKGLTVYYDANKLKYRPRMLRHSINLKTDDLFSSDKQQDTYRHLSGLKLFKTTSVQFDDIGNQQLNANIFVTPQKTKSTSFEFIGTNSGGNLGVEMGIIHLNKNLFHGGERLTIKLRGGLEIQQLINETEETKALEANFLGVFNTLEFGPEVNLEFPRFLLPISLEKFSRRANPKTYLNYVLNFQQRPEYIRNLTTVSFGYYWNENQYKKHFINPINYSIIKLNLTEDFENRILAENNPFIVNSFTDHFINSTTYTFIYTNQEINKTRDFEYLRLNAEVAGNVLSTYHKLTNEPKNENNQFEVFGIQYAQFIKGDIDYRHYNTTPLTSFVSRISLGIGKPYGNLNVLPFEKSYYGGGANDIRAWQARTLGPGSLPDSLTKSGLVNQIGELKIEGNLEYRFDLTTLFEGAVFLDAGNIWTLRADEQRPNAEINLQRFWQDVAVGVGFGLRLDFNFFLIRFDLASKLKDPASDAPKDFQLQWRESRLNLGIGYPF